MISIEIILFLCLLAIAQSASLEEKRLLYNVADGVAVGSVSNNELDEASTLCASRKHPGILYSLNDKGGQNRLYAINSTSAQVDAILVIEGATNNDWEDAACGKCFGHTDDFCVYIGDTGDAGGHGSATTIYRIQEPDVLQPMTHVTVDATLKYSWNEIDAETLMISPQAELYIISKVDGGAGLIAHIPNGGWGSGNAVQVTGTHHLNVHTTHNDPLDGDISPDGQEVLVKTRNQVLHFNMMGGTDYPSTISGDPYILPYIHEHRGESIAFSLDGNSYYTIGEGHHPTLYRYDMKMYNYVQAGWGGEIPPVFAIKGGYCGLYGEEWCHVTKKAAMTYGIPRTTLIDKLTGKAPVGSNPGKRCVLTGAEEVVLEDYVKIMASIGYPLKRQELCFEVKKVLDHDGRTTPFKDNLPGKHWYQLFARRHPALSERTAMALGHQRSLINYEMIEGWFDGLKAHLKHEVPDWENLVKDPRRIFNADESGFPLSLTNGKVLTEKGVRHVYQVTTSNKTQITVLACFNAIGNYVPPLIVYPGERFRDSGIHEFAEAIYGHTSSGWMDSELFVSFLKHLHDFVTDNNIPKPVMLLVDGHSTHMSLAAAHFCFTNGIILYCLLANATHVLQPCDVGFFSPMKAAWKKEVKTWQLENLGQALTKKHFPGVFKKAWAKVAKIENAVHGFQKCGLFPLNPRNIDLTKLNPSKAITRVTESDQPSVNQGVTSTQPTETTAEDKSSDADLLDKPTSDVSSCTQSANVSNDNSSSDLNTSNTSDAVTNDINATSSQMTTVSVGKSPICNDQSTSNAIEAVANSSSSQTVTVSREQTYAEQGTSSQIDTIISIPYNSSQNETRVVSYVTQSRDESVSKSFSLLPVPEIKKKRTANAIRNKLPKALSGKEALRILQEREDAKRAEEFAKQKRKEDRLEKKAKKLEEKEQKRIQREENKKKRKQAQLEKLAHSRKRKHRESASSDSDVDVPKLMDSDDDYQEELTCPGCESDEGSPGEWIHCIACPRRWHITCTGDAVLFEIPASQMNNYPFHCEFCM